MIPKTAHIEIIDSRKTFDITSADNRYEDDLRLLGSFLSF